MKTAAIVSQVRAAYPASIARLLVALSLFLFIPALSYAQSAEAGTPPPSSSHTPAITTNKIVVPQISGARITADRDTYADGQPVVLTFKVTNTTRKPIHYEFPSGQQATFSVTDSKGASVWDSPLPRGTFRGITYLALAAGQSQTYQATWNERDNHQHPVQPGDYTATAQLVPMQRVVVSNGIIVNTDPDPENTGMPTKNKGETGAVLQQDITPPVSAKMHITIRADEPKPASHGASAH